MSEVISVDIKLNKKTFDKLKNFPSKFLQRVARQTLDLSYIHIPRSANVNAGRLRSSSMAYGVKNHSRLDYSIGSDTSYAKYVWKMDNSSTKWTTPGTGSKWYLEEFKRKGNSIVQNAIKTSL